VPDKKHTLRLKRLGIDTYKEAVIYMHTDCHICRSEGFEAQARIQITLGDNSIMATLNTVDTDLLDVEEASLSNYAWELLKAHERDIITLSHPKLLGSVAYIRSKIYGNALKKDEMAAVIKDVTTGYLSDVHIATFLTACAGGRLDKQEILYLTEAMLQVGDTLTWNSPIVVDKHSIGGLPGNRTSLIIVPIVTAFGLTMPKTSSRAITSPAGTADTMEVFAPVELDIAAMRKVVEAENGCIVWGGLSLSPADDIIIRIERAMDIDSEGQVVASILSKKIASGSTHIVLDIPIGPTAKVRTPQMAQMLKNGFESVCQEFGIKLHISFSNGLQPIGRGIGPALEAKDILAVLRCEKNAPQDLRDKSLTLAGQVLEFSPRVLPGTGKQLATTLLDSGQAWKKFQAICQAQGGMFEPPTAFHQHVVTASISGHVRSIDNRRLARVAKLAGAPRSKAAGVELLTPLGSIIEKDQPLFIIHAETAGELRYTVDYFEQEHTIIQLEP